MSKRPPWDNYWFTIALMYSTRGTCDRLRTACVIVKKQRLVGAGYNGSPQGSPHCDDVGHLIIDNHCERTIHGEVNAVINTERSSLIGATAYVIGSPCIRCSLVLVNAGISKVCQLGVYKNSKGIEKVIEIFKNAKVTYKECNLDPNKLIEESLERLRSKGGALYRE